jgi:dTDP-4-amino-4,6-dideoxygalactose transaminase
MTTASSCTTGLSAVLIALGARGTVLFPAFTFPATHAAIVMAGARAGVLDVDPSTWSLSSRSLERAVREQGCDAVVLVAPFGMAQDFREHFEICSRFGIPIVIDNAAGLGGTVHALPHEKCFEVYSLHATKVFAIGEGGAIRSRASEVSALHRALNFGLERGCPAPGSWGINGKLPEFSAAVGLAVLETFEQVVGLRRFMAASYSNILSNFSSLHFPRDAQSAPWQTFPVLFPSSDASEQFLRAAIRNGVEVRRYYHPTLEDWPRTDKIEECPNARSLSERMICLPVYSELGDTEGAELFSIIEACLSEALA